VIGAVYGGAKTFSETVLTDKSRSFKHVVVIEFPRNGIYSLGFITADEVEELNARSGQDMVSVFVPHTPNAATGFIVIVPRVGRHVPRHDYRRSLQVAGDARSRRAEMDRSGRSTVALRCRRRPVTSRPPWKSGPGTPVTPVPFVMPMRTHYCGEVNERLVGSTITVAGWVNRRRDHGGVIFVDLRDREGLLQVVFDPSAKDVFAEAERLRGEWVVRVTGLVRPRPRAP
jgi:hypothetical protein